MTQLPWPLDNQLVKTVEERGKKGARAIKKDCIDVLNKNGERFDWEDDDLSELEVVNEQSKLVDPGVADILLDTGHEEELGGSQEVKENPSYVTRAVAARRRAGLHVESEPRQTSAPRSGGAR